MTIAILNMDVLTLVFLVMIMTSVPETIASQTAVVVIKKFLVTITTLVLLILVQKTLDVPITMLSVTMILSVP